MSQTEIKAHVYTVVNAIPLGQVCSYGKVAQLAGIPGSARYVGRLLKELPAESQLPWHRVIRADGRIPFPLNSPQFIKQQQKLHSENVVINNGKISLAQFGWK